MQGSLDSNIFAGTAPCFGAETALIARHGGLVAGIDEAGRGPLAGPVVAAAVILDLDNIPEGIDDSKKLTPDARASLHAQLSQCAQIAVGIAEVDRIDSLNILHATMWAMSAAISGLPERPASALVDGNRLPELPCPGEAVVNGDALSLSIAAASIVAKVTRDRLMVALAREYPGYGWERNKGYSTREHFEGIARLGVTVHHRRSFAPVRAALGSALHG